MSLDALEKQVLGDARREMAPTLAESRRVYDALVAQIGATTVVNVAGASSGGWLASLGAGKAALLLTATIAGMSSLAWWSFRENEAPIRAAPSARPSASVVALIRPAPNPPTLEGHPSSLADAPPRVQASRQSRAIPSAPSGEAQRQRLAEEVRLLKRADQAIREGTPDVARSILNELSTRYPNGQLLEERAATDVLVLCQRRQERAARAAREFLATYPDSVYAPRLRAACIDFAIDSDGTPTPGN